jgi:NADH-ubiquinone oxidoreductase chain 5
MYLAIITLPLLGSIVSGFFGRKVGVSGAQLITCTSVIVTTLFAIVAFFEVGLNNVPVSISLFRWIDSESLNVLWGFHFDSLTVSMLIPVLIVSSLVHIYSIGYMSHDPHNQRFFSYLSLFTFMMVILVTANNFLLMFVGWEGVGICSYLLVSFWFTRIAANQSSMSAFLTNRVGDCFLTIGMFAILWFFGNIDYSTVFSLAPFVNENIVTIIGICLLIGAMAKSSQVGLHVWLPMAMEGPTPVSALIHAATMVTAGVYLLMRTSPLIEYSSTVLILCLWLGAITTVFSSLIGLFQQDIKKVIAYSTMSQLGMMVIAVGLSSYNIALFHLVNHAFYKGLLFLGAGAVIHAVADNQDFRKYGGLRPFLPLTYSVMLIASLSLVAFPFMTGFYSKDFILESAYGQFYFSGTVVYFIATIGAMFTTLYSVKVLYLTFLTNPNGPFVNYKNAHEGDIFMSLPLIILAILSIFFGYITKDIFLGLGSGFFADNSLFIHPTHEIMLDTEFAVPTLFKLLPLFFTISLSVIAIIFSEFLGKILITFKFSRLGYNIFGFFNQRFLIELFYNKYITGLVLKLGGQTTKVLDKGSVELLGPYGLEKGLINLSINIVSLDTGVITSYALYILIGLIFYILIPYLSLFDNSLLLLLLLSLFSLVKREIYGLNYSNMQYKDQVSLSKINLNILFNNKVVKKAFTILLVGYSFKGLIQLFYHLDVTVYLSHSISIIYYTCMSFLSAYLFYYDLPNLREGFSIIKKGISEIRLFSPKLSLGQIISNIIKDIKSKIEGPKLPLGKADLDDLPILGKSDLMDNPDNAGSNGNSDNSGSEADVDNSESDSDPGYADNQSEYDAGDLDIPLGDTPDEANTAMNDTSSIILGNQDDAREHREAIDILENKDPNEWSAQDKHTLNRCTSEEAYDELKSSAAARSDAVEEIAVQAANHERMETLARIDLQGKKSTIRNNPVFSSLNPDDYDEFNTSESDSNNDIDSVSPKREEDSAQAESSNKKRDRSSDSSEQDHPNKKSKN